MRYFFLSCFLFLSMACFSQPADSSTHYCEIKIVGSIFKKGYTILLEDDESISFIKDEYGKDKKFETRVAALNYMGSQGWELVTAHSFGENRITGESYYIFKKKQPAGTE